jgi:hypothetical protein
MKKLVGGVVVALGVMLAGSAMAQSAKSSMQVSSAALLQGGVSAASEGGWSKIFATTLKTSQAGDMQIGVSLEAGLFTDTLVRSKGGTSDTSMADAMIEVQVLVDGRIADPGNVVFARRQQSLMAKLGGIMRECADGNGDGIIKYEECAWDPEELQLVLNTMNANAFFFAFPNVGVGVHNIEVQARITTNTSFQAGAAAASAVIGKGAVTVEEVKYIHDFDVGQ